jgi:TRAP-type uncharacterized transport system substrate-binding protein
MRTAEYIRWGATAGPLAIVCLASVLAAAVPTAVVLGTATRGGGFELYGRYLAEVVNATDASACRLARALHRGEAQLGGRLAQARCTTAANTAAEAPRRELIHPGVARYLREIGALR